MGVLSLVLGREVTDPVGTTKSQQVLSEPNAGTWALPGGHLEFSESLEQCAHRELLEETGINARIEDIKFLTAANTIFEKEQKHYVTIFMGCWLNGDPVPQVRWLALQQNMLLFMNDADMVSLLNRRNVTDGNG
jgi:ADP-ribose pyrophosphatase YjhB (NUDIX family)